MIVADTCLIVHLYNETKFTGLAQKVLEKDSNWIMPFLWKEEYANVLSKIARKENRFSEEIVAFYNFTLTELKGCAISVEIDDAIRLSIKYKISVYDAHFVTLATYQNTILITEDKEILKKCPHIAVNMQHFLKDY